MNIKTLEEEVVIVNVEIRADYEESGADSYPDDDGAYDNYLGDCVSA